MAATKGVDNWNKNWRSLGNIPTVVKNNSSVLYEQDGTKSSTVASSGTSVIYMDSLSGTFKRDTGRTKYVAISGIGTTPLFTNIDNLIKPKSLGAVNLSPQSFGLGGTTQNITSYVTSLIDSINTRPDLKGELREYLLELVDYANTGSQAIVGYDLSTLGMNSIISQFGETIGPIYCIRRGLSRFNLGVNNGTLIYMPSSATEPLLDYILISNARRVKISAKAVGTSNTLKMNSLVPAVLNDDSLRGKYISDTHFNVMRTIHENTMISGPIRACAYVGIISGQQASSIAGEPYKLNDNQLDMFDALINQNAYLRGLRLTNSTISTKHISFVCEKMLINYSKQTKNSNRFTEIVKDVLTNEIYFAKFGIDNGIPNFNVQATTGVNGISNLVFRTKNGYMSKSDKLGFKL